MRRRPQAGLLLPCGRSKLVSRLCHRTPEQPCWQATNTGYLVPATSVPAFRPPAFRVMGLVVL